MTDAVLEYLVYLLDDVVVQVVESSVCSCGGGRQGTLDDLWGLHELLRYLIQTQYFLLHVSQLGFQHLYVLLGALVAGLQVLVLVVGQERGPLERVVLLSDLVELLLPLLVLVFHEISLLFNRLIIMLVS